MRKHEFLVIVTMMIKTESIGSYFPSMSYVKIHVEVTLFAVQRHGEVNPEQSGSMSVHSLVSGTGGS